MKESSAERREWRARVQRFAYVKLGVAKLYPTGVFHSWDCTTAGERRCMVCGIRIVFGPAGSVEVAVTAAGRIVDWSGWPFYREAHKSCPGVGFDQMEWTDEPK